jgi:hypothetical protein
MCHFHCIVKRFYMQKEPICDEARKFMRSAESDPFFKVVPRLSRLCVGFCQKNIHMLKDLSQIKNDQYIYDILQSAPINSLKILWEHNPVRLMFMFIHFKMWQSFAEKFDFIWKTRCEKKFRCSTKVSSKTWKETFLVRLILLVRMTQYY